MLDKPPLPAGTFDPWPRITVDQHGQPFHQIHSLAQSAAIDWILGPDGPFKVEGMTMAEINRNAVGQALLHLFELGLIDVDEDRLWAAKGWPRNRSDAQKAVDR